MIYSATNAFSTAKSLHASIRLGDRKASADLEYPEILLEELHPLSSNKSYHQSVPSIEEIADFIEKLYSAADLSVECVIISLIYVNRLLDRTGLVLHPKNWLRIFFGGTLLAAKVWDDHAVWNIDFCEVFLGCEVEDL